MLEAGMILRYTQISAAMLFKSNAKIIFIFVVMNCMNQ